MLRDVVFEKSALDNNCGRKILKLLNEKGYTPVIKTRYSYSGKDDMHDAFAKGKQTLVIGSRNVSRFETCKPSADFQLPVFSGCPGMCEYCYLMTRTGEKPYTKLNTNLDKVYSIVSDYIKENNRDTYFELSASSDPIPFEPLTEVVSEIIEHFGKLENARLRICTKFEPAESIIKANHNGHTDFRFSVNTKSVINKYEHATPDLVKRVESAQNIIKAGYSTGIMIAPVFIYNGWENDYKEMLSFIKEKLGNGISTFEVVTHRYTAKAKAAIKRVFPDSGLEMEEENRQFKFGQFGYGKYLYAGEKIKNIKVFFTDSIAEMFPNSKLLYVV